MNQRPHEPADVQAQTLATELRIVIGQVMRRLREQGMGGDLTPSQQMALSHLERDGPATVTALARAAGVRPQSMGATVTALEAAGWVSGSPDPKDGRQTILALTPACVAMIKTTRTAREDWLFHALQTQLAASEQAELSSAINLLKRLVRA